MVNWFNFNIRVLTFTGAALTYEAHHEGGALVALSGRAEGLHHELVRFGLWRESRERA